MLLADSLRSGAAQRVALVTGASGGIGEYVVAQLTEAGYTVLAQHRVDGGAERLRKAAQASGGRVEALQADLSDETDVKRLVQVIEQRFPAIECLVHAAAPPIGPLPALQTGDDEFLRHLSVQTTSFAQLARCVLPLMQRQQKGVILGVLSAVIESPRPKLWWPYTTAKFATLGLLSGLSTDVEGSGVRVVGVLPAGVAGTLSKDAGLAQDRLLEPAVVASTIRRAITEPLLFPNGSFAKIEPSGVSVGRMVFTGTPLAP